MSRILFELNLGLICFFVLSGFLLYQAFARASLAGGERVDVRSYAIRRVARIAPAYYVCIAGCLLLYWVFGPQKMIPPIEHWLPFTVFAQNYSPGSLMKINPVTWTLSIEVALYVVLPLIGLAAYRLGPRRIGWQVAMLISFIGITLIWNGLLVSFGWQPIGPKVLPAYIGHFALGMLGALWLERRRRVSSSPISPGATAALFAAGAACVFLGAYWHEVAGTSDAYRIFRTLPAAFGFALMITAAAGGMGPAINWLRAGPLVAIGVISYGIYLWHLPLLLVVREVGLMPEPLVLRVLVVSTLAIGAGFASWRLVERPMIERYSGRRERATPERVQAHAERGEELRVVGSVGR